MNTELIFTQEIKDKWLTALKSGEYTQGFKDFKRNKKHCCIAVLEEITGNEGYCWGILDSIAPYTTSDLIGINDKEDYIESGKTDYSNVIPVIEQLPVQ